MPRFEDLEDAGLRVVISDSNQVLRTVNAQGSNVGIGNGILWQSGIPFVLPGGDGGSNGLTFTGTRGLFTLSAAILSGVYAMLQGCYLYLPAGAGGLAAAGWYWATFSSDTAGEVFQETYVQDGSTPKWIASPTAHPNLTSGRITQTTSEVTAVSFILPGGSMGPNGIVRGLSKMVFNSSGNTKSYRVKMGGTGLVINQWTNTNLCTDFEFVRQNTGIATRQIGNRPFAWLGYSGNTIYLQDNSAVNTASDLTIAMTLQVASNTDSAIGILRQFQVIYGA